MSRMRGRFRAEDTRRWPLIRQTLAARRNPQLQPSPTTAIPAAARRRPPCPSAFARRRHPASKKKTDSITARTHARANRLEEGGLAPQGTAAWWIPAAEAVVPGAGGGAAVPGAGGTRWFPGQAARGGGLACQGRRAGWGARWSGKPATGQGARGGGRGGWGRSERMVRAEQEHEGSPEEHRGAPREEVGGGLGRWGIWIVGRCELGRGGGAAVRGRRCLGVGRFGIRN